MRECHRYQARQNSWPSCQHECAQQPAISGKRPGAIHILGADEELQVKERPKHAPGRGRNGERDFHSEGRPQRF
jgi:hypothetical protein